MRGRSFVLVGAAACLAGAGTLASGCDSRTTPPPKRLAIVRESCNDSWVPSADTFKGFSGWRRTSLRIGPITLMGAKVVPRRDWAAIGNIKFRTLVRPQTPVRVEIAPAARSAVGFVSPNDALHEIWPKHGAPIMRLAPCPMNFLPYHGLRAIGYPMFLRVRRNACVGLTVRETRSGRSARGTVSIGAGRCPS